ncbi:MAG TPA: hypothetical protein VHF05_02050 [Candidatus Paceibacterota bacterium]|jgi:hypothetical protein|nr:hypothetical protein [Candidatus Paceibacterota bacterium]
MGRIPHALFVFAVLIAAGASSARAAHRKRIEAKVEIALIKTSLYRNLPEAALTPTAHGLALARPLPPKREAELKALLNDRKNWKKDWTFFVRLWHHDCRLSVRQKHAHPSLHVLGYADAEGRMYYSFHVDRYVADPWSEPLDTMKHVSKEVVPHFIRNRVRPVGRLIAKLF